MPADEDAKRHSPPQWNVSPGAQSCVREAKTAVIGRYSRWADDRICSLSNRPGTGRFRKVFVSFLPRELRSL